MIEKRAEITKGRRWLAAILTVCMLLPSMSASAATDLSADDYEDIVSQYAVDPNSIGYEEYVAAHPDQRPDRRIEVDAGKYVRYEEDNKAATPEIRSDYEGMAGDSVLTSENSLIEFEITVPESGYYDMSLVYYPVEGKNSAIQRSIFLDGQLPYAELDLVEFQRVWKMDAQAPTADKNGVLIRDWQSDNQGNNLKPGVVEAPEWLESYVYDSEGYITSQLALYLTAGEHTITITGLREPMLLRKVIFSNTDARKDYDSVKAELDAAGVTNSSGQVIRIEAENASKSSSQMLYAQQDQSSPAVYPSSPKELLNNTIGGNSWRLNGQWIEWEFDVPESGYYNIAMFVRQNFMKGIYVSRKISIDNEVLFE